MSAASAAMRNVTRLFLCVQGIPRGLNLSTPTIIENIVKPNLRDGVEVYVSMQFPLVYDHKKLMPNGSFESPQGN